MLTNNNAEDNYKYAKYRYPAAYITAIPMPNRSHLGMPSLHPQGPTVLCELGLGGGKIALHTPSN